VPRDWESPHFRSNGALGDLGGDIEPLFGLLPPLYGPNFPYRATERLESTSYRVYKTRHRRSTLLTIYSTPLLVEYSGM
jgi:hypothetical protein